MIINSVALRLKNLEAAFFKIPLLQKEKTGTAGACVREHMGCGLTDAVGQVMQKIKINH